MNKSWKEFMKSGKIGDYLRYKEEYAKELKHGEKNEPKGSNSPKKS